MTQALLLSLLLFASPLPPVRPGTAMLARAQGEFGQGDFPAALRSLDAAKAENPDVATLARVELLEGQIYAAQRDLRSAEQAFARALEHDPDSRLDPDKVDPELVKVLDTLRERSRGELRIATGEAARVVVDDRPLGPAPVTVSLPAGPHRVMAWSLDLRRADEVTVVVVGNKKSQVTLALSELKALRLGTAQGGTWLGGHPLADVRVEVAPVPKSTGLTVEPAIELGTGLEWQYFRAEVHARVFPHFGLTARGAFNVPIADSVKTYVALEVPVLFVPGTAVTPVSVGLGGGLGAEAAVNPWFSAFAELGGRHFFLAPGSYAADRFTAQLGARLRLP